MKTQYITNSEGKKIAIILPLSKYEKMIDMLEELDDICLYDKAKKESSISFDDYLKIRKKNAGK